jgi:KUP system potassium uptake protein
LNPAISVLSATEGVGEISANLAHLSVPITVFILVALFAIQFKGSGTIGKIFGPIILLWFATIGYFGYLQVKTHPEITKALLPNYAIEYVGHHGLHTFIILSSVILAITGAEALYADLGHFGKRPIRLSWFVVVAPALVLNYLGQAVIALNNPGTNANFFFALAPSKSIRIYLVIISTLATIIASQALITGVASLSRQAVRLGLLPRMKIIHTSKIHEGQIYVPFVNLVVGLGSVFLVINFRTSAALANAYSFAISATMALTTLAFGYVAAGKLHWNRKALYFIIPFLFIVDFSFFLATVTKILKGAWVPLLIGLLITYVMWVWRTGQRALGAAVREQDIAWEYVEEVIAYKKVSVIPGTGIYLSSTALKVPQALAAQIKNLHSCPEKMIIVTVFQADVPFAKGKPQLKIINDRVRQLYIWVGFNQDVNIQKALIDHALDVEEEKQCTYYLADRKFIESPAGNLRGMTEKIFAILHRNSTTASSYFGLPEDRVITLGTQMDL